MSQFVERLKKSPSLIVGIVALIVCGGVGLLRAGQLNRLSDLEAELNAKLDKIRLNIKHSENIEQDTRELKRFVNLIEERLFVGEERSTNINFFYSFEDKLDIVISEVSQVTGNNSKFSKGGPNELTLYAVVDYSITLRGTFKEILRFLYEIDRIDSIVRVTDFQIDTAVGREDGPGKLLAKVRIAVLSTK